MAQTGSFLDGFFAKKEAQAPVVLDKDARVQAQSAPEPEPASILAPDQPAADPVLEKPAPDGTFHKDSSGQLHRVKKGKWSFASAKDKLDYVAQQNPPTAEAAKPEPVKEKKAKAEPKAEKVESDLPKPVVAITAPAKTRIYFRAVPSGPYKNLDLHVQELWNGISKSVAQKTGDPEEYADLRILQHDMTKFMAWKGLFATVARANPPEPGDWVMLSRSDEGQIAFDVWAVTADEVTRGV